MAANDLADIAKTLEDARSRLVEQYVRMAWTMWRSLNPQDWWNDGMTMGAAARLAILELQLIAQVRRLGISYADQTLRLVGTTPSGDVPELVYPRVNTDPQLVASKPVDSYRGMAVRSPDVRPLEWPEDADDQLFKTVNDWLESAYSRLRTVAEADVERAQTSATLDRYRRSKVLSYRRVLHPELSKSGSCGLCIVAADRWYSTSELLPIHDNCHCGVAPAGDDSDPGFQLNRDDLQRLYSQAGGNRAKDLANVRVKSFNHGELGPVLDAADARAIPNPVPDSGSKEWFTPDRKTTLEQYRRMMDRSIEFGKHYKSLIEGGGKTYHAKHGRTYRYEKFTYEGRTYRFKTGYGGDTSRLEQAWAHNRALFNRMQASLSA